MWDSFKIIEYEKKLISCLRDEQAVPEARADLINAFFSSLKSADLKNKCTLKDFLLMFIITAFQVQEPETAQLLYDRLKATSAFRVSVRKFRLLLILYQAKLDFFKEKENSAYIRKYPNPFLAALKAYYASSRGYCEIIGVGEYVKPVPFIQPGEILKTGAVKQKKIGTDRLGFLLYSESASGKHILHQPFARTCGYSCACMLLLDKGIQVTLADLFSDATGEKELYDFLQKRQASPHITSLKPVQKAFLKDAHELAESTRTVYYKEAGLMQSLEEIIRGGGSAIIRCSGEIGPHFILLDCLDGQAGTALIRDPYHGWEITITEEALYKRLTQYGKYKDLIYSIIQPGGT